MARSDRKEREFERREEEILDAALALCSTPQFESVTVEQIADRADVGKGTVYKHFASKDELLFRLHIRFYRGLLGELRAEIDEQPPLQQLRRIIEYAMRYHLRRPEYRYVVEYCSRLDFMERAEAAWRDDFLALDRAFADWGTPMVLAGMESGVFETRPVDRVLVGMHACFKGSITMLWAGRSWCPFASDASDEELVGSVSDFMMAGLVGRPG